MASCVPLYMDTVMPRRPNPCRGSCCNTPRVWNLITSRVVELLQLASVTMPASLDSASNVPTVVITVHHNNPAVER